MERFRVSGKTLRGGNHSLFVNVRRGLRRIEHELNFSLKALLFSISSKSDRFWSKQLERFEITVNRCWNEIWNEVNGIDIVAAKESNLYRSLVHYAAASGRDLLHTTNMSHRLTAVNVAISMDSFCWWGHKLSKSREYCWLALFPTNFTQMSSDPYTLYTSATIWSVFLKYKRKKCPHKNL